jgi:predicted nucleotidyltransferase
MMDAEGVMRALNEHREELRRLGVRRLSLFGSVARNEATDASDLDFLVEFQQKSFDAYMDLKSLLERLFSRRVDLVLPESLKPRLRDRIAKDKDLRHYATGL